MPVATLAWWLLVKEPAQAARSSTVASMTRSLTDQEAKWVLEQMPLGRMTQTEWACSLVLVSGAHVGTG